MAFYAQDLKQAIFVGQSNGRLATPRIPETSLTLDLKANMLQSRWGH
jgi:hypothetical protein